MCNLILGSDVVFLCMYIAHIYIYVTSNAGFQIYRITIIHIHISTISNIFYLQDFDRFMKGYWSQKTFPPLPSRLWCALFFPKPPMATWLQQNASGRKYILSVTYATNFIENTLWQYTFKCWDIILNIDVAVTKIHTKWYSQKQ